MKLRKRTGFTISELLVTLVIFSFGLLPLIVLFQSSHKQTAQAKNLMVAHSLGRTIIAEIRSLGFQILEKESTGSGKLGLNVNNKPTEGPLVKGDPNSIVYPAYYKRFNRTVKIKKVTDDKIRVELKINWKEPGRDFDLNFGTVVTDYEY